VKRTIQDRLASLRADYDVLISEARIDYERKKIEAERAQAALVDAEIAGKRMNLHARAALRPRHMLPIERDNK
jgi:hypothetical protein